MHIEPTHHEHGATARAFVYEADFDLSDKEVRWKAVVHCGGEHDRTLSGSIPMTSPASPMLAERAVRDAIVSSIDVMDDRTARPAAP